MWTPTTRALHRRDDLRFPSDVTDMGLPQTGDRPGSAGADSNLAGLASAIGWM
jgi:hypothetical protein